MTLSPLAPDDIGEVMRLERRPGYEAFVGRWTAEAHAAEMASPRARYFGLRQDGGLAGFVILQELDLPTVLLRRIAVDTAERGVGGRLLGAISDWVFGETHAQALRLEVAHGNDRAHHVYVRAGYEDDGQDDVHVFMRLPRERWAGGRRR